MIEVVLVINHLQVSEIDNLPPRFADRWKHLSDDGIEHLKNNRHGLPFACDTPGAHWFRGQRRGMRAEPFVSNSLIGWVIRRPFSEIGE